MDSPRWGPPAGHTFPNTTRFLLRVGNASFFMYIIDMGLLQCGLDAQAVYPPRLEIPFLFLLM